MGKRKRKMRSRAKRRRDKLNERNGVKQVQQRIQDQKNTDIDPAARDEESVIQAPTTSATAKIQDEVLTPRNPGPAAKKQKVALDIKSAIIRQRVLRSSDSESHDESPGNGWRDTGKSLLDDTYGPKTPELPDDFFDSSTSGTDEYGSPGVDVSSDSSLNISPIQHVNVSTDDEDKEPPPTYPRSSSPRASHEDVRPYSLSDFIPGGSMYPYFRCSADDLTDDALANTEGHANDSWNDTGSSREMERHFATTFILDDRGKENDPSQGNNVPQVDGQGDTDTSSSDDADESWVPTSQKLTGARKRKSQQKVMVPRKPRCTEPKAEKEQEQDAAPEVIEIDVADLRHAPLVGGFSEDLFKTQDLAATPGLPCPSKGNDKGNDPVQKVEGATLRKTQDRSKIKGALKNQSNATFTHVSTGMEVNIEDEVDVIGDGYGDGNSQELFPTIHTSEESGTHEVGPKNIYEVTTDEAADTDFQNTQTSTCPPVSQPVKSGENTQSTSNTDVRPRRRLSRRRGVHSMNEKAEKLWRTIRGTVTFDPKKARPKTKHSMYSSDSSASPDRSVLAGVLPKRRPKNRPLVRPKEDVDHFVTRDIRQTCYVDNAFEVDNPDPIKPDSSCTSNLPDDDEAPTNIDEAFAAILIFGAKHHTPLIYQRKMYNMMNRLFHEMGQPLGKSFDYKRKLFRRTLPRTTVTYVVEDRKTHLAHRIKETAFRRSLFPAHKFKRLFTETRINLREQILFHANHHKDDVGRNLRDAVAQNRDIDIYVYIDGVPPSKSGKDKMIIEAFRLPCCRQLMNLQIIHHDRHFEVFADDLLLGLIEEFNVMPAVKVKLLVADLPERCRLAGKVNFNGEYGCLHCTTNGEARDKGIGYVYPLWTLDAADRDDESYHTLGVIAEATKHAVMGVKEKSLLFKFNGFSITENLPIDPMHLLSGLINYFWVQSTTRLLNNRLAASVKEFVDNYYGDMVVPSDFKRDTREIDVANFKWSEWKQLLLLGGLEIANAFQQRGQPHAAEIWRILMFVVRAMCLPDEWYLSATAGGSLAVALIAKLYGDIEDLLGKESCTPNLHNLSHLPAWREKHRLHEITAEIAESHYGDCKAAFCEKAASVGLQIHWNMSVILMGGHSCFDSFHFEMYTPGKMDHIVVDNKMRCYQFNGSHRDGWMVRRYLCRKIKQQGLLSMKWEDVGVFQVVGMEEDYIIIPKKSVCGRGVMDEANRIYVWTRDMQDC